MTVRRFSRAAAGSIAAVAFGLLTACGTTTDAVPTPSPAGAAAPAVADSVKTASPSRLCSVLTVGTAKQLVAEARPTARVSPGKGDTSDICRYASADGKSMLSLGPASRAYDAELSAAHHQMANPASDGMRDVRIDPVSGLGLHAFRKTAHQVKARRHITLVVWNAGARTWVLTFATAANTSTTPATVSEDKVLQVARSITSKLPAGE
ncbi:hypothetical protein [Streptomyces sp. T028]|uniref:hypothetical protein n=1 Tax=Streptomyces sp. T028 TaxID=3394379 RepID=UPI003A8A0BC6